MLKKGQKVIVKKDTPFGQEPYIEAAGDNFFIPPVAEKYAGKIVTISDVHVWRKLKNGNFLYYYRIEDDDVGCAFLEEHLEPTEIKDFYLIHLVDDTFLILSKKGVRDIVFMNSFNSLADEIKEKCQIISCGE